MQDKAESNIRRQVATNKVQVEQTTRNSQPCALACMGFMKVTVANARALKAMQAKTTQYLQGADVHSVINTHLCRSREKSKRGSFHSSPIGTAGACMASIALAPMAWERDSHNLATVSDHMDLASRL